MEPIPIPLDYEDDAINSAINVLKVLSSRDAFSIFVNAATGIRARSSIAAEVGLTKRSYYGRIRQLMQANLITKTSGSYVHTSFGTTVYNGIVLQLLKTSNILKSFQMIDALKDSGKFSSNDIFEFIQKTIGVQKSQPNSSAGQSLALRFFWKYDELAAWIIQRSHYARKEILIATRFYDEGIINAVSKRADSGVSVRVIATDSMVGNYLKAEIKRGKKTTDKHDTERKKVVTDPWYPNKNVIRTIGKVPFCIIIFDRNEAAIELVNANDPSSIRFGLSFIDEKRACDLAEFYIDLWDNLTQRAPSIDNK